MTVRGWPPGTGPRPPLSAESVLLYQSAKCC
jgi:hypothetical protein